MLIVVHYHTQWYYSITYRPVVTFQLCYVSIWIFNLKSFFAQDKYSLIGGLFYMGLLASIDMVNAIDGYGDQSVH